MKNIVSFEEPPIKLGCSYGDIKRANLAPMEYQVFQIVYTVSVATVLLFNTQLHRFYKPLARIVDFTLFLKVLSFSLYFTYYPYGEGEGNCLEIFTGRLSKCFIMIGEMHQIYLLAHVLGVGKQRLAFMPEWMSLEQLLNLLSVIVVITIFLTYNYMQIYVRPIRHIWSMVVAILQLNMISFARAITSSRREYDIISTSDPSIVLFEKLSLIQLFPCAFLFFRRLLFLYGIIIFPPAHNLEGTVLIIDDVVALLFFIKVLVVTIKANVSIDIVVA